MGEGRKKERKKLQRFAESVAQLEVSQQSGSYCTEEQDEEQGWWVEPQLEVTLCSLSGVLWSGDERRDRRGPV